MTATPKKQKLLEKVNKINSKKKSKKTLKFSESVDRTPEAAQGAVLLNNSILRNEAQNEDGEIWQCPNCDDVYEEVDGQPTEDWIQCTKCKCWYHEECCLYTEFSSKFCCDACRI